MGRVAEQRSRAPAAASRAARMHPSVSPLGAVLVCAVAFLVGWIATEHGSLFIIDNQIKFLQTRQILSSGFTDYSLPWAGKEVDPDLTWQPMVFPFYAENGGNLYSAYSPLFPAISALPYAAFGHAGLYILPLLGSVLALFGLARLAAVIGLSVRARSLAVVIAGLLSPLWFYSAIFWEHNIAVAFCMWALSFVMRYLQGGRSRDLVIGFAIAAIGVWFRDDLYVFCGALALVAFARSPGRRRRTALLTAASLAAAIVPLWLFQWAAIGQPFGFHIGVHLFSFPGLQEHVGARWEVFYRLFIRSARGVGMSLVVAAPFLVAFVLNPRFSPRGFVLAVPVAALLGLLGFLLVMRGYLTEPSPLVWMLKTNSLFSASPVLILAFLRVRSPSASVEPARAPGDAAGAVGVPEPMPEPIREPQRPRSRGTTVEPTRSPKQRPPVEPSGDTSLRTLWWLTAVYIVAYGLASPLEATEGIHWGNRLVLALYPIFALMAANTLDQWLELRRRGPRSARAPVQTGPGGSAASAAGAAILAVTLLASFAGQVYSLSILERKKDFTRRLNEAVEARPERAILTDVWYAPPEMYSVFYEKAIFRVQSQEDLAGLLPRLWEAGHEAVLFATEPRRPVSVPPVATIDDRGLNRFSLKLVRIERPR